MTTLISLFHALVWRSTSESTISYGNVEIYIHIAMSTHMAMKAFENCCYFISSINFAALTSMFYVSTSILSPTSTFTRHDIWDFLEIRWFCPFGNIRPQRGLPLVSDWISCRHHVSDVQKNHTRLHQHRL